MQTIPDIPCCNAVTLEGFIDSEPCLHHTAYKEKIYSMILRVPRLNAEVSDYIPINMSERSVNTDTMKVGTPVKVEGQYRSFNEHTDSGHVRLILAVYAKEVTVLESTTGKNSVELVGFICKPPTYRKTPLGREISDMMVAVRRPFLTRSDYLPAIAWGRNAKIANKFSAGTVISIEGRIQSRVYQKRISEDEVIERTAYEVSITSMEVVGKDPKNLAEPSAD